MIKSNNFVKTLSDKGLVDDAVLVENGYDIQYKGNIVSVRLNDKGGALIYNQKKNTMMEIESGRLDDILHRYIIQSLFGTQTKTGIRNTEYKNVFLVPTKVIKNAVVFEDSVGRSFVVNGATPQAVLSYYNESRETNCDDVMVLLNGFTPYDRTFRGNENCVESSEVELQLLKCAVNHEDYSVCPCSDKINDVGQTVVGNFFCSSADKVNLINFEEDCNKAFAYNSVSRRNISSATMRAKNPFAIKAKQILSSDRKALINYADKKYPYGLCLSAMEQMLAYEAPAIFSSAKVDGDIEYKNLFSRYLREADTVQFRLDSNKTLCCSTFKTGKSAAKFRCTPDVASIRNNLMREGYYLTELESGLEFNNGTPVIAAIISACKNFVPVSEEAVNKPNTVTKVIGSECTKILADYGINDTKKVFNSLVQIIVN